MGISPNLFLTSVEAPASSRLLTVLPVHQSQMICYYDEDSGERAHRGKSVVPHPELVWLDEEALIDPNEFVGRRHNHHILGGDPGLNRFAGSVDEASAGQVK